ncbi:hypothetical protein ISO57_18995, partial [Morganella morganii subsp. morganii]|nr:hypothetical protein [Morganella morganii subsp. morganii]MBT0517498.1 hypothetical protein [Morganella morganii subsp. morganii]
MTTAIEGHAVTRDGDGARAIAIAAINSTNSTIIIEGYAVTRDGDIASARA